MEAGRSGPQVWDLGMGLTYSQERIPNAIYWILPIYLHCSGVLVKNNKCLLKS